MKPRSLYNAWMPLVVVVSIMVGAFLAARPYWRPAGDREFIEVTRPKHRSESWVELDGPTQAVFSGGAPFTAFTARVDLEMPSVPADPPGVYSFHCGEFFRSIKAVAVHDGEIDNGLPRPLHTCHVVPKHIHPVGLLGNWLFVSALCGTFGWALLFAASRRPSAEPGRCSCGYDLSGLRESVCPECGTARGRAVAPR